MISLSNFYYKISKHYLLFNYPQNAMLKYRKFYYSERVFFKISIAWYLCFKLVKKDFTMNSSCNNPEPKFRYGR